MTTEDKGQSGYYQTIARAFLERRGGPFFLSPKDQSTIAAWEAKRIPVRVVLEGIGRTFDGLRTRRRGTKGVSLSFCERQVDASFTQHKDRTAGRVKAAEPRTDCAGDWKGCSPATVPNFSAAAYFFGRQLNKELNAVNPDEAALERLDAEVEDILWARATAAEKEAAAAEVRKKFRGRRPEGLDDLVRRKVVKASRDGRRIPHVSLFYY